MSTGFWNSFLTTASGPNEGPKAERIGRDDGDDWVPQTAAAGAGAGTDGEDYTRQQDVRTVTGGHGALASDGIGDDPRFCTEPGMGPCLRVADSNESGRAIIRLLFPWKDAPGNIYELRDVPEASLEERYEVMWRFPDSDEVGSAHVVRRGAKEFVPVKKVDLTPEVMDDYETLRLNAGLGRLDIEPQRL